MVAYLLWVQGVIGSNPIIPMVPLSQLDRVLAF